MVTRHVNIMDFHGDSTPQKDDHEWNCTPTGFLGKLGCSKIRDMSVLSTMY